MWVNDTDSNQWVQPSVPLGIPNAFSNITLNDSSQLSSSGSDTLNIVDGPGIEVSSDPSTNTLTISNTGSTINNLNDIQNVNISSVANGQTLVYNSTSGKWENGAGGTGSITFTGSTIDSDDSSQIVFTPSSKFSSDVIVENDVVVANKISASEFVNTSTGTPTFDSASTITLKAPDGVVINLGALRLANFTNSQRDAYSANNGDMIYNTEDNRIQAYINGVWRRIDDSGIV